MNRLLALGVLTTLLAATLASANGPLGNFNVPPGQVGLNAGTTLSWGGIGPFANNGYGGGGYGQGAPGMYGYGGQPRVQPYQLGPWYQYWPYEAHFQQPAIPQYPYWGSQGLPGGLPYVRPGYPGHGAVPAYWGNGR